LAFPLFRAFLERMEPRARKEIREIRVKEVQKDYKDLLEKLDPKDHKAFLVRLDHKDLAVIA
jgi:hypothetical protein